MKNHWEFIEWMSLNCVITSIQITCTSIADDDENEDENESEKWTIKINEVEMGTGYSPEEAIEDAQKNMIREWALDRSKKP